MAVPAFPFTTIVVIVFLLGRCHFSAPFHYGYDDPKDNGDDGGDEYASEDKPKFVYHAYRR